MWSFVNPVVCSTLRWKLRAMRNEAVSIVSEIATCATTSAFRPHRRLRPGRSMSAALSPVTRSARELCSAGASPHRSALTPDMTRHARRTRVSIRNGMVTGSSGGIRNLPQKLITPYATAIPPNHPRHAEAREEDASVHPEWDGHRQLGGDPELAEEANHTVRDGDPAQSPQAGEDQALRPHHPDKP